MYVLSNLSNFVKSFGHLSEILAFLPPGGRFHIKTFIRDVPFFRVSCFSINP